MPVTAKSARARREPDAKTREWARKRGPDSKIHLAADAHGMPVRVIVTAGAAADCAQAPALTGGIAARYLLADRGRDTGGFIDNAAESGCEIVIPPRKNYGNQRGYDKGIRCVRHLAENAFSHLGQWRGIAARYAKAPASFAQPSKSGALPCG